MTNLIWLLSPNLLPPPHQFYPIYSDVKKSKETGNFEDFIECLKLYDKMENGTMMLGELEHILLSLGELLEKLKHSQFKLNVESH